MIMSKRIIIIKSILFVVFLLLNHLQEVNSLITFLSQRTTITTSIVTMSQLPSSSSTTQSTSTTTAAAATTNQATETDISSTTTQTNQDIMDTVIPNWRLLSKEDQRNDKVIQSILLQQNRPIWDKSSYEDSIELYNKFIQCTDEYVSSHIKNALSCIDHAIRLYGPNSVLCSFNGGKDAVVILHLVRAAFAHYYSKNYNNNNKQQQIVRPRVIYFDHKDEFTEILHFLHNTVQQYDLDMIAFGNGTKFQDGLKVLVDNNKCNNDTTKLPMAFVLGTRLTDPNAVGQQQFAPSSHYMPPFMRVNPILDWTYGHVWHFLRLFSLSYCTLYDQGYTSLGTVKDTIPCPALAVAGQSSAVPKYWPAYMLRDWDQERAGRIGKATTTTTKKSSSSSSNTKINKNSTIVGTGTVSNVTLTDDTDRSSLKSVTSIGHLSTMSEGRVLQTKNVEPPPIPGEQHHQQQQNDNNTQQVLDNKEDGTESDISYCTDNDDESSVGQKTVGLLIIGDEILKGFTPDTNTQAAATALRKQNVVLKQVVVVSDNQDDIVQEIQRLRSMVDVVITSGGVGPTHDDVTMKSVAKALNCEMQLHEEMATLLKKKMNTNNNTNTTNDELTEAQIKMATLPTISKLRYLSKNNDDDWPVLQCKNIFILPGIPEYFGTKIENVAEYLSCQLERSLAYKVVLQIDENSIVSILNQVVDKHPNVVIGSYPFISHPEYKTVITVEGRLISGGTSRSNSTIFLRDTLNLSSKTNNVDANVQMALDDLINLLPKGSVLRVDNEDLRLFS